MVPHTIYTSKSFTFFFSPNILFTNYMFMHNPLMDQNMQILNPMMSSEEAKIRDELEMEIENDLEQEIKDGIYHLALRLHRLYQHQKNGKGKEKSKEKRRKKMVSEVNISIKLEGGTMVEIKESKKEEKWRSRSSSTDHSNSKRFDWERSLRSGSETGYMSLNIDNNGRGSLTCSSFQRSFDNRVLELGWKC